MAAATQVMLFSEWSPELTARPGRVCEYATKSGLGSPAWRHDTVQHPPSNAPVDLAGVRGRAMIKQTNW